MIQGEDFMYESNKKNIKVESAEEAIQRGVKIEKDEGVMPNSFVYPKEYGMQRRRRRSKYKDYSNKVDVRELLSKCSQEQKEKLMAILEKQGIKL